jgi:hypothetical protein
MLHVFVLPRFRSENRVPLFGEELYTDSTLAMPGSRRTASFNATDT